LLVALPPFQLLPLCMHIVMGVEWGRGLFIYNVTILMYLLGGKTPQHHTIKLKDRQLWAKLIYS
jgi:hypothetical protein